MARFVREHGYGLWSGCVTDAEGDTNELPEAQIAPTVVPAQPILVPPAPVPEPAPASDECDPSYPTVCIPPVWVSGDLDRGQIGARRFTVPPPDPHGFDGDSDGVGCESG